ncbi:hypothetical protein DDQ41_12515 [Streptomyces spongiicola]|uniref:Uncharacterized protein n=1 Tax=Streptomyces spongiicola TaxID=1690221 RepID=A0ABN5KMP9_9ACTN|nr:hypothetical protein DDQ41_12515 [Streptomyces spongiicola]
MHRQPELPLEIADCQQPHTRLQDDSPTLDKRFDDFHASHPWILEALEELTAEWIEGGGERIGVKALFEKLRWSSPRIASSEPFRLNNNFTSRYARLLCARHPEWASVFQLRSLRTSNGCRYLTLDGNDQVK